MKKKDESNVFDIKDDSVYTAEQARYIRDQAYTHGRDVGSSEMSEWIESHQPIGFKTKKPINGYDGVLPMDTLEPVYDKPHLPETLIWSPSKSPFKQ